MAIRLKQEGIDDFVIFERDTEVGGACGAPVAAVLVAATAARAREENERGDEGETDGVTCPTRPH